MGFFKKLGSGLLMTVPFVGGAYILGNLTAGTEAASSNLQTVSPYSQNIKDAYAKGESTARNESENQSKDKIFDTYNTTNKGSAIALIVGVVVLVFGTIIYALTRKKKK